MAKVIINFIIRNTPYISVYSAIVLHISTSIPFTKIF